MRYDLDAYLEVKRRRLRAARVMMVLALICVLAALTLGLLQLHAEGLNQFLFRAPGVGASK